MSERFQNGYALIVGVGADLPNTVGDAIDLADILKDSARFAHPHGEIYLLTSEQATRDLILSTLYLLAQSTDSLSTVIVYFSGHGYQVSSPTDMFYYLMSYEYDMHRMYQAVFNSA